MNLNNRHSRWEKDAPNIASAGRGNPFSVPEGYFHSMQEQLKSRVAIEEVGNEQCFQVPDGYFTELPGHIEAKIAVEELKEELSKEGFKVPSGYFEALNQKITERTISKKKSRVFNMPVWVNYAAAACVTVILGVTVFFNMNNETINSRISKIPDHAIESYLNIYTDQTDVQLIEQNVDAREAFSGVANNLSERDLEEYIQETSL
jgi:hypothetical protein